MTVKNRTIKGRFAGGKSGNPSGRPPGSRNQSSLLMEALLSGEAEKLTRKVINLALKGDAHALRLCMERLMPPGRDRLVRFDLPIIQKLDEVPQGMMSILAAVSQGEMSPAEGELLSQMLADYATVLGAHDFERRLQKLEHSPLLQPNELAEDEPQNLTEGPALA